VTIVCGSEKSCKVSAVQPYRRQSFQNRRNGIPVFSVSEWMRDALRRLLTFFGTLAARPATFLIVFVYAAIWAVVEPDTLDLHGVATLATWLMTLVIQRAEHRDTQAIQAKLDELIKASGGARNEIAQIDRKEPEEIEKQREREAARS
jgi:low affinity Fe/Cu permease